MTKQKQEYPVSFKVGANMKSAIDEEMELDSRDQAPMIKILIAEAISIRRAKRSMNKLL